MRKTVAILASTAMLLALPGCATPQKPDPLESWNRKVFAFNESVDSHVLKPVAEGYKTVTPEPVRTAFGNFAGNIRDVWSTINLFLQGRFKEGSQSVMRVAVNTTFGLAGLLDIATPMQLYKPNQDFGLTLGVWGVKPGAFIVWPLLGPSTLRDTASLPGDWYFSAGSVGTYPRERNLLVGWQVINTRANLLEAGNLLDDVALDKYAFIRDAYLQRRQNLIYEGDPPQDDQDQGTPDPRQDKAVPEGAAPAAEPAASGASSGASSPDSAVPAPPAASSASAPAILPISEVDTPATLASAGKHNPWAMFP